MDRVSLKLSTVWDTDLHIQDNIPSWMKLIEEDDHRLTKAVSRVLNQKHNGNLILPWTETQYLLYAFGMSLDTGSTSTAKCIQAIKAYYLTVEGFLTSDPLLLNLRCVAGHIMRECDMYIFGVGSILGWKNKETCVDTLMNGHWEELIGKVEELLHATDNPDNYCMHIQRIIQFSSDSEEDSFLRLHMMWSVIEAMSSSSASDCASALVNA